MNKVPVADFKYPYQAMATVCRSCWSSFGNSLGIFCPFCRGILIELNAGPVFNEWDCRLNWMYRHPQEGMKNEVTIDAFV